MTDFNQKTHDTDVGSHGGQSRQMMEVFENQEFGSIRVLQEAGKTFFCASDVAKALGYVNPYAAVKRHCRGPLTKREGVVQKVNQYGDAGEQVVEISFITEGDVYRLIVHSKLPSAERFEHWVFDEVLPSIRKHGVYMSDSILDQVIQHPEVIYTLAQKLVAEREQLEGIRKQLDAAQPKADYFDTFVNSEDCTCIRNFCKEIGIQEKTAVALLLDHRYLYRSSSGWLMPFADKSARGYFIVRDCYGRSGKLVQQGNSRGDHGHTQTEGIAKTFSSAYDQLDQEDQTDQRHHYHRIAWFGHGGQQKADREENAVLPLKILLIFRQHFHRLKKADNRKRSGGQISGIPERIRRINPHTAIRIIKAEKSCILGRIQVRKQK
jgi:prophage antirepressor-like protein